jgi:hypothetical protein
LHRAGNGFSYGCQMKNPSRLPCIENVEEPRTDFFAYDFPMRQSRPIHHGLPGAVKPQNVSGKSPKIGLTAKGESSESLKF